MATFGPSGVIRKGNIAIVGLARFQTGNAVVSKMLAEDMKTALLDGAKIAENRWKELAPIKTGTYRRSIHTTGRINGNRDVEVIVGTNIIEPPYPVFLEFGTSRMPPHPSARPAFHQTLQPVLATAKAVLAKLIAKRAQGARSGGQGAQTTPGTPAQHTPQNEQNPQSTQGFDNV